MGETSGGAPLRIDTLSTFPEMFDEVMGTSIMGRAQASGIIEFKAHNLRDWTCDRHHTTDDDPYGGGPGLVMKCEPIFAAHESIRDSMSIGATDAFAHPQAPQTIILAPWGERFSDAVADELATASSLIFICGHYEGIDERVYELADRVLSIGDYVLTSGELAALVIIDAVVRKLPGALGAPEGATEESFANGLLEYPQYTRPATFRGMTVPEVLLSGDHGAIARYRRQASLARTATWRPDLLTSAPLDESDRAFLRSLSEGETPDAKAE